MSVIFGSYRYLLARLGLLGHAPAARYILMVQKLYGDHLVGGEEHSHPLIGPDSCNSTIRMAKAFNARLLCISYTLWAIGFYLTHATLHAVEQQLFPGHSEGRHGHHSAKPHLHRGPAYHLSIRTGTPITMLHMQNDPLQYMITQLQLNVTLRPNLL